MYAYKVMMRNNSQCSKCESGHLKLVSFWEITVSDSTPNTKWYFPQQSWGLLYYLLFLILSSLISFLFSILSFFVNDSMSFSYSPYSSIVFSYTLIYKCPHHLSSCTIPIRCTLFSVHHHTPLAGAQGMSSSSHLGHHQTLSWNPQYRIS